VEQTVTRTHRNLCLRRLQPLWRGGLLAAAVLAAVSGCGSSSGDLVPSDSGDSGFGGSGDVSGTGGVGGAEAQAPEAGAEGLDQNPVELLLAEPQRNPGDFLGSDALGGPAYGEAAIACYAAPDACGASDCNAFASCCVDTASCCKPTADPRLPGLLDFVGCAGSTLEQCVAPEGIGVTTFGPREPLLTGRGLVPNGTASSEGGAIIGQAANLSSYLLELEVQFTLPLGCNGTCLESAGVGFTTSVPDVFVDPEVGLLLSGSRETVSLILGGTVADSFDAGTSDTLWSLVVSPPGSVEVYRDGARQGAYQFDSTSLTEASLAAYGRNVNVADTSAAIASIELGTQVCDNPRAWAERQPTVVLVQGTPVATLRAPSIEQDDTATWVAFERDGEIFVGPRQQGEVLIEDGPALVPSGSDEALGIGDPELVWDGNDLLLFYTARDENGTGRIHAAVASQSSGVFVRSDNPVLEPSGDVASFDAPTVILREGLWLMVARATLAGGVTELRAYYTSDLQTGWAQVIEGGLEPLTRVSDPTSEISSPSLIVHNSAYHLYYARRTGTRWSVELAVSDELLLWRGLGVVMGPSGLGFDSLGASGPDALSGPDRIDLVYTGQDGISFQLGSASRPAPSGTAPTIF
jgi:hypothetical protein